MLIYFLQKYSFPKTMIYWGRLHCFIFLQISSVAGGMEASQIFLSASLCALGQHHIRSPPENSTAHLCEGQTKGANTAFLSADRLDLVRGPKGSPGLWQSLRWNISPLCAACSLTAPHSRNTIRFMPRPRKFERNSHTALRILPGTCSWRLFPRLIVTLTSKRRQAASRGPGLRR